MNYLKESDIIKIIEESKYKDVFNIWRKSKTISTSLTPPDEKIK